FRSDFGDVNERNCTSCVAAYGDPILLAPAQCVPCPRTRGHASRRGACPRVGGHGTLRDTMVTVRSRRFQSERIRRRIQARSEAAICSRLDPSPEYRLRMTVAALAGQDMRRVELSPTSRFERDLIR